MKHRSQSYRQSRGIVLLVVLGMLSLFTVLVVTFVVFSAQEVSSSVANSNRQRDAISPEPPFNSAIAQIVAGTTDHRSALYGNSFLEDFYGVDGGLLRVGHRRAANPGTLTSLTPAIGVVPLAAGGQLLLPLDASNGRPRSTLFKFPSPFVRWNYNGEFDLPPNTAAPYPQPPAALRTHLDDAFTGRVLAFQEGPLKDRVFRVVRYFGNLNGTSNGGVNVDDISEYSLAGNFVVDLAELGEEIITIDGVQEQLYLVAANFPNRLLYDPGADGQPGRRNIDDDGNGIADDASELGWIGSDDYGYQFILNGSIFNGRGVNPGGASGLVRNERPDIPGFPVTEYDRFGDLELQINSRLSGANYSGGRFEPLGSPNLLGGFPPEFDEAWDAADIENLFLAWQPSDHRRAFPQTVYGGVTGPELNRQMGQQIIPSFHRPSIVNYLMNTPIRLANDVLVPGSTGYVERTFWDIRTNPQLGAPFFDDQRIRALMFRIRRAIMRPLNFSHAFYTAADSDLDKDGLPFDGAPQFSGSNPTDVLNQTIDINNLNLAQQIETLRQLAIWAVNGPWDIDNDGDGLPDSIWTDFNLPTVTAPDGQQIKPMVAALIEDMDGRININYAGNYAQLNFERFNLGPQNYSNAAEFANVFNTNGSFGNGGGVGPAEIDFSHLFQFDRPAPGRFGPLPTSQLSLPNTPVGIPISIDDVLLTRYGNLLNSRYGGQIYDYSSPYPYVRPIAGPPYYNGVNPQSPFAGVGSDADFLKLPGAGTRFNLATDSDLLSRVPMPGRRSAYHNSFSYLGRPIDLSGMVRERKDVQGDHRFSDLAAPRPWQQSTAGPPFASKPAGRGVYNELSNHPYEFGATEVRGDDAPFTPIEYVDFIRGGPLDARLSQLLGDAADRNEALRRLITTESRSVDLPELPGVPSIVHLMSEKWEDASGNPTIRLEAQSIQIQRMLGVELRKGGKLNLNRVLSNSYDTVSPSPGSPPNGVAPGNGFIDENDETRPQQLIERFHPSPILEAANTANNRSSRETAFPAISRNSNASVNPTFPNTFNNEANTPATYHSSSMGPLRSGPPQAIAGSRTSAILDFDGIDQNGDGILDRGTPFFDTDGDGTPDTLAKMADGSELLARHLYCLMFALIENTNGTGELVPNFPYPTDNFFDSGSAADIQVRNRYVAKRLAQWAVNAVDYRDADSKCSRLRYDWNPFDANGFDLDVAVENVVWGMERPEVELTEAMAFHNKRTRRDLDEEPNPADATLSLDGEFMDDEDPGATAPFTYATDSDMDQFRIPEASAVVEIHSLASPVVNPATGGGGYSSRFNPGGPDGTVDYAAGTGETQRRLPAELYTNNALDLGRVVGTGVSRSPVWRLAVGEPTAGDPNRSTRLLFDADRMIDLSENNSLQTSEMTPFGLPDYLRTNVNFGGYGNLDLSVQGDRDDLDDDWNNELRHLADIRPSHWRAPTGMPVVTRDPPRTEYVTLADTDLNPANDFGGNNSRIELTRFVWFANLPPVNLRVVNDIQSGMRPNNVFFNQPDRNNDPAPGANNSHLPGNAAPLLQPGQYAVVAPRSLIHFGQKRASNAGNNYAYDPSDQRFQLVSQGGPGATPPRFRFNYYENGSVDPQTPAYQLPNVGHVDVNEVLPLICESLYPREATAAMYPLDSAAQIDERMALTNSRAPNFDPAMPAFISWQSYSTNNADAVKVDMGFNISAPLPGPGYYPVPSHRINTTAPNDYPRIDGYRDYVAADGFHPDTPFDLRTGLTYPAVTGSSYGAPDPNDPWNELRQPLAPDVSEWARIGTHEEAVTIFLQRLADPTSPWNPVDNPYVTVDFIPMDLTTFSGEADPTDRVDRIVETAPGNFQQVNELADSQSVPGAGNEFDPLVRFDSRRKIPDWQKDRGISLLLGGGQREVVTKRSALTVTTNVLRPNTPVTNLVDYWPYELGSNWDNGNYPNNTINTDYIVATGTSRDYDSLALPYGQTFGFVNREYGLPTRSTSAHVGNFGIGNPDKVQFMTVPWMDRNYQSQYDLLNVPAVSRTGLLDSFSLGTDFERGANDAPTSLRERIEPFTHLLGFANQIAEPRQEDMQIFPRVTGATDPPRRNRRPLGFSEDAEAPVQAANQIANRESQTGTGRAGFEQIFDYVDTGPIWFDSQRWLDPTKLQFIQNSIITPRPGSSLSTPTIFQQTQMRMYNRAIETLQPPYNYVPLHRTPGKINLNTTPDYIRKAPLFGNSVATPDIMLDGTDIMGVTNFEDPSAPGGVPANARLLGYNPSNQLINGAGVVYGPPTDPNGFTPEFNTSELFGNGSVYRSLSVASSNPYELDITRGAPSTIGENNQYERTVDTPFGRGFKAFIESRRGHSTTQRSSGNGFLGNPELDWRYPTRFAGVFTVGRSVFTPSVPRFMRQQNVDNGIGGTPVQSYSLPPNRPIGFPRRMHDMSLLRSHPDFDKRTMTAAELNLIDTDPNDTAYTLRVEFDGSTSPLNDPTNNHTTPAFSPAGDSTFAGLRMPLVNTGLFERPQAELHSNLNNLDRDSFFRYKSMSRLANKTSNHSNVFLVRLTLGYFVVNPATGAVGAEYVNETGDVNRSKATYMIDRTIPVGYLQGFNSDFGRTIIYAEVEE